MKNILSGVLITALSLCVSGAAFADETVFSVGETASSEAFGVGEGRFYFVAAVLCIAAIYALIYFSRSVHQRVETELRDLERLIAEKKS